MSYVKLKNPIQKTTYSKTTFKHKKIPIQNFATYLVKQKFRINSQDIQ